MCVCVLGGCESGVGKLRHRIKDTAKYVEGMFGALIFFIGGILIKRVVVYYICTPCHEDLKIKLYKFFLCAWLHIYIYISNVES